MSDDKTKPRRTVGAMMEAFYKAVQEGKFGKAKIEEFFYASEGLPLQAAIRNIETGRVKLFELDEETGLPVRC